jgi:hypothetical protein
MKSARVLPLAVFPAPVRSAAVVMGGEFRTSNPTWFAVALM